MIPKGTTVNQCQSKLMQEPTYRLGTCPLLGTYLVSSVYTNELLTHNMTFDLLESPQTSEKSLHLLRKVDGSKE
jgi:hypothetical protein